MKTISKFLIFTLVILLVSLGAISATENVTDTTDSTDNIITNEVNTNNNLEDTNQVSDTKTIEKITQKEDKTKEAGHTITITNSTYDLYFKEKENTEFVESTNYIQSGDTINLKGNFKNLKFAVDKNITFTSLNKDAKLEDCTVYVLGQKASGSTISNLNIFNNGTLIKGIQVKEASKLLVENNTIKTLGLRSYGFVADNMNNSVIRNNYFEREGDDWRYITFLMGVSYYNTISNNTLHTGGANGIYLSIYGSAEANFDGGQCDYNNITNNTVIATGYITSWCYTIQSMGAYNLIANNTVQGGFRGISTQNYEKNIIVNNDVHAISQGIYSCEGATVENNTVHVTDSAVGIAIGSDNVTIANNTVTSENGQAIDIYGNNILIANNTITSTNGYGIYSKGTNTNIIIDNNKINSQKEGILFKHQSRYKKMNHVFVNKNTITSQSDYAINFEEVGSLTASEINVTVTTSNVLTSNKGTGTIAYLKPTNSVDVVELDSNQVLTITPEKYLQYFTNGVANDEILQNATIYLEGTFNDVDFVFNRKVHLIGNNALINDGTITLSSDAHASTINNINISNKANKTTVHGIELIEVNNCQINNVTIKNFADKESLGVFLYDSSGNTLSGLTITTSGDFVNNAILLYASDSNNIVNNQINLNESSNRLEYADSIMFNEKIGTIQEVLHNHGIILLYSSSNNINKNTVKATSMFKEYTFPNTDCRNSMVGIDIYFDSHNNKVTNNQVSVIGKGPYNYGIGVLGGQWGTAMETSNSKNNVYDSNNVYVEGGYFGTGFIAGRNSVNTTLKNNNITVKLYKTGQNRGDFAHGITLENSTSSNINNNIINLEGASTYGMELFHSGNNQIQQNTINTNATYPYGIAGTTSSNNNILNNTINNNKVNYGQSQEATHGESIESGDQAIMLTTQSTNNIIRYNSIKTNTNTTIELTNNTSNNNVTENSLIANTTVADQSVNNPNNQNTVKNNFVYFTNITVDSFNAKIGDSVTITSYVNTTTNDYSNLTVSYKLGITDIGSSKVINGKSSLKYTIPTFLNPTVYQITAQLSGTNFQNNTAIAQANLGKPLENIIITVEKTREKIGNNITLKATVTTADGGKIGTGQTEFYIDENKIGTVNVNLGEASINCNLTIEDSGIHTIKAVYLGTGDYASATGTNILAIQANTSITLKNHTAKLGENNTITSSIQTGNEKIKEGTVKIFIDDNEIGLGIIENGQITLNKLISAKIFDSGNHILKVVYKGNDTLAPSNATATIYITNMKPVFNYNITSVKINDKVVLKLGINNGKNGEEYYASNNGNVSIQLNGETLKDSKGNIITAKVTNGIVSFTFTAPQALYGSQDIGFKYSGDSKFDSGEILYKNGLIIGKKSTLYLYDIDNSTSTVKITGKLLSEGKPINKSTLTLIVNNDSYTITPGSSGYFSYSITPTYGINTVQVLYEGDNNYSPSNYTTIFTSYALKKATLYLYAIDNSTGNVAISGKLLGDGKAISGSKLTLKVNSHEYVFMPGSSGYFSYTVSPDTGVNDVTVTFAGNDVYAQTSATATFTSYALKKATLYLYAIDNSTSSVVISGKLLGDGKAISGSKLTLKVNSHEYVFMPGSSGYFSYTVSPDTGVNDVTVTFAGNDVYAQTSATATFTSYALKKATLYLYAIDNSTGSVVISGKLLGDGKAISGSKLTLKVNSHEYVFMPGSSGYFSYTVSPDTGVNNVEAMFAGNDVYAQTSVTASFTSYALKKPTLYLYSIDNSTGSVVISGKLLGDGKAITGSKITIKVNDKSYTITPGSSGYFSYTITPDKGVNNVTVTYAGNDVYAQTITTATFTSYAKKSVILYYYEISNSKIGEIVLISGKLLNTEKQSISGQNITVEINSTKYITTTNKDGYFSYRYPVKTVGTHTVTMTFNGNEDYESNTCKTIFTVK